MTNTELKVRLASEIERGPLFAQYPPMRDLDFAVKVAMERIEEWDYDEDPHGWCHDRPIFIALLRCALNRKDDD